MENTRPVLKNYLKKRDTVIVAVSGGPDSVYLLYQCIDFKKTHNINIIAGHINHKLRAKESDLDENFVRDLCKKNHITFELCTLSKIKKGNVEEEGRLGRYTFLENIRKKHGAKWILTAHHRDDNIETVLFNLIRGSFLSGIKGIAEADSERHILRPLLDLSKAEILKFLKQKGISFRIDKSNLDTAYSRNLLRHKIIPLFKKINPNFANTFYLNLLNIRDVLAFLDSETANWLKKYGKSGEINLDRFMDLPEFMQKNILAEIYRQTHGDIRKFNRDHLQQLLGIIRKKKTGLKKEFGDNHFITIVKKIKNNRLVEKNLKIIKIKPCQ
jgi:tRNA(Ile)-lysidine synthase